MKRLAQENLTADTKQGFYIEKIREMNEREYQKTKGHKLVKIQTFGCQMNAHDSEKLLGLCAQMGYGITDDEKEANLIIYNTCCVRENAENKVYGNLGYLKHRKEQGEDLKIVVCGCMMQQETVIEKIKKSYRNVDVIFGTFNLHKLPELLHTNMETKNMVIDIWENHDEIVETLPVIRQDKFKASVNIMYGCDNFCTYCIVPYVRGRERSRPSKDILLEIEKLAGEGVVEVTLLGQNVNSYGMKPQLEGDEKELNFSGLLREVNKIDGIERIRFMTSHPKDMSLELIETIRDCNKICKHVHLPFQAGSDAVLKGMNRKYTKQDYLKLIDALKREIKDVAISTDIIVGFPGETEEDFEHTIDIVEKVQFSAAFTFIYSKRTGTKAALMENQIPEEVSKIRFNRLIEILNKGLLERNLGFIGKTLKVLAEENLQDEEMLSGRTEDNGIVHFKGDKSLIGKIVMIKITDCKTFYLQGEII